MHVFAKHKGKEALVRTIIRKYKNQPKPDPTTYSPIWHALDQDKEHEEDNEDMPPLCADDHEDNDPHQKGPIGILIRDLHDCGYTLKDNLDIVTDNEPPLNLLTTPIQHLKKALFDIQFPVTLGNL